MDTVARKKGDLIVASSLFVLPTEPESGSILAEWGRWLSW